jgi:hypothetical protein
VVERTCFTPDTHELAWAAGFFDGEGNIRVKFNKQGDRTYCNPGLSANQIDPQVLERFKRAVMVGKVYGPYDLSRYGKQPQWCYEAYAFEHVQAVVAMLWKWLSPVKRQQATRVLLELKAQYPENIRLRHTSPAVINAARTHCKHGHPFDESNTRIVSGGHRQCRTCYQERLERARRGNWNARKTHCKRGHPFDEVNTLISDRGHRQCRICARANTRRWKARRRAMQRSDVTVTDTANGISTTLPGLF